MSECLIVVGYAQSHEGGHAPRALLVAQDTPDGLRYAGRVTAGLGRGGPVRGLEERLVGLQRRTAPVADVPQSTARRALWVRPELAARVEPREVDADGLIRKARLIALKADRRVREPRAVPDARTSTSRRPVPLSRPDEPVWPDRGITRSDLAAYWEAVAERVMEHAADHAVSLVRHPAGIDRKGFVQRHPGGLPQSLFETVDLPEADGTLGRYLVLRDPSQLADLARLGVVELHRWQASARDPDPGTPFPTAREAAVEVRAALRGRGLVSFALPTGGRGVHLVAPLRPQARLGEVAAFASSLAAALVSTAPDRYTTKLVKAERGRWIFVDTLRNRRGATAICPWSPRARPGAPVATMVSWDEWASLDRPAPFDLRDVQARIGSDPWPGWRNPAQTLVGSGAAVSSDGEPARAPVSAAPADPASAG